MMDYILTLVQRVEEDDDLSGEGEAETFDDASEEEDVSDMESEDEDLFEDDVEEDALSSPDELPEQLGFVLPSGPCLALSEAIFQLSMMFWTYKDPGGDMASSALIHFTNVLGIRRHSLAYKTAYNSTSQLSSLIWIGRLLFLEYALPLHAYTTLLIPWPARSSYESQEERLEAIRTKYLLRGSLGPFGEVP
jgi:hypothetical protein